MSKEERNLEKNKKVLICVKLFLENDDFTISDISHQTGIPKSSVQRYLSSEDVKNITTSQVANYITNRLKKQRKEASSLGGINSKKNNIFVKDSNGKFMGSVKNLD